MRALEDFYEKSYPEFIALRTKCKEILQVQFVADDLFCRELTASHFTMLAG